MTENEADSTEESSGNTLDLSGLTEMDFGPSWAGNRKQQGAKKGSRPNEKSRKKERTSGSAAKRDRRGVPSGNSAKTASGHSFRSGGRSQYGKEGSKQRNSSQYEDFQVFYRVFSL